ncbi:DnaD domain protein [Paenibacillus sp. IB182496]|uniref:DnaD domain protein n=2 Tax=Paenibacillus sabuli TaxID=2772509 RepID=A0A927GRB3_9BACL|nr:DnaD domain protein [Paenibacillus sabuli]
MQRQDDYAGGMAAALQQGGIHVPAMLLRTVGELGIAPEDAMLLLQLMAYRELEGIEFPTPDQLGRRMGRTPEQIGGQLQRLLRSGLLEIEDMIEPADGLQAERYSWSGWLLQAASCTATREGARPVRRAPDAAQSNVQVRGEAAAGAAPPNLFVLFEREFGRPLSPMELETISAWIDQDGYADELIRFALKEAVFAGKLHFRYIDRILLEWSRNRITNVDEARAQAQKFRGRA